MFPWIVVLAVLGLVMIFAEILMPGFGLFLLALTTFEC